MRNRSTRPRLPAEWEPQSGILLTWPHQHGDWGAALAAVEAVFIELARHIAAREQLLISCFDPVHLAHVAALLADAGIARQAVDLRAIPSNDSWARDHGPIAVIKNGAPRLLDFHFNGWGGKFPSELDDRISRALHDKGAFGSAALDSINLILEGGSIDGDGAGGLLTTTRCLLAETRNPGITKASWEKRFADLLGIHTVHWLENGHLAGDDTDGHIDTLARFCSPTTIAYASTDGQHDSQSESLGRLEAELAQLRTPAGKAYDLVGLPLPNPIFDQSGRRLPATYANFLIINEAVLVPTYNDPADGHALERLTACFPEREVIGIDCIPLLQQSGSLHCVTMQLPRGVLG